MAVVKVEAIGCKKSNLHPFYIHDEYTLAFYSGLVFFFYSYCFVHNMTLSCVHTPSKIVYFLCVGLYGSESIVWP